MEIDKKLLGKVQAIQTGKIAEMAGTSKSNVNAALIGAGTGLLISIFTGQSKFLFAAGGAVAAVFLNNLISKRF